MPGFDPNTWYVLTTFFPSLNNTLTAGPNTQIAFDPNSPSAIYLGPRGSTVQKSQQWQLVPIADISPSTYILRNRVIGAGAYLSTARTTRKCGGSTCATVPVLSPYLDRTSIWNFTSWGFDNRNGGGAWLSNLGNGSDWQVDVMDNKDPTTPEMTKRHDTGRLGQHWNLTSVSAFSPVDKTIFSGLPATATAFLGSMGVDLPLPTPIIPDSDAVANDNSTRTVSSTLDGQTTNTATPIEQANTERTYHLSNAKAIIIGVGLTLSVFIMVAVGGLILSRYRRRRSSRRKTGDPPSELPSLTPIIVESDKKMSTLTPVEFEGKSRWSKLSRVELAGHQYQEMPATPLRSKSKSEKFVPFDLRLVEDATYLGSSPSVSSTITATS